MNDVMMQAQLLAEAIVNTDAYKNMREKENAAASSPAAAEAMGNFMEKRHAVEELLSTPDVDPAALSKAGEEMEQAEKAMQSVGEVKEMQAARKQFSDMMENVNRVLRFVITGNPDKESGSCSGDCSSCQGCE